MSIEQSYNQWVSQYDTNVNRTRDLDQKAAIETLGKFSFSRVLELGCGTGKNTQWLLGRAQRITALDFSQGMLDEARRKIKSEKVTFIKCDLKEKWPVADECADLVTCSLVLEHIESLEPVFKQVYAKLTNSGRLFVSELHSFRQYTGSKAKFETGAGTHELEVFVHHVSDYSRTAAQAGLRIVELNEWFDEEGGLPRLITFVFEKSCRATTYKQK